MLDRVCEHALASPGPTPPPHAPPRSYDVRMPWGDKYRPLVAYLAGQRADEAALSFAQIEAMLGAALPTTAYVRNWWWSKGAKHLTAQPWRAVGWEAALARRADEWRVTFRRRPAGVAPLAERIRLEECAEDLEQDPDDKDGANDDPEDDANDHGRSLVAHSLVPPQQDTSYAMGLTSIASSIRQRRGRVAARHPSGGHAR